ncbi:restriction endonuclease subunit S, partial [Leyella stercorea]
VTKGLNPNVKMKDSGIPWIGEIPEHWTTRKIKFLFKERSEKGYPNEPVLCATQKYGVIPQSMYENRVVVVNKGLEGLKLVKEGDFVISLRSFQGGIEYAHYQGIISAAYTVLSPSDEVNPNYIKYLFKSHPFIELLKTCVTGIREGQNINFDLLRKSSIMLPPLSEQQAIVSYIDEKLQKIDQYMADLQREIDYLKEFKQRLISDAVTGQLCITKQ